MTDEDDLWAGSDRIDLSGVVLDCANARELADFYQALLGWELCTDDLEDSWLAIKPADGAMYTKPNQACPSTSSGNEHQ